MFGSIRVPNFFNISGKMFRSLISSRFYAKTKVIQFTLVDRKAAKIPIKAEVGAFIYDAIIDANISDYGVCGGCLLCTSCHVIFKPEDFDKVDPAEADEVHMLKHTLDVTPMSRLGCQLPVTESMDGIEISLPCRTQDARDIDLPDK